MYICIWAIIINPGGQLAINDGPFFSGDVGLSMVKHMDYYAGFKFWQSNVAMENLLTK